MAEQPPPLTPLEALQRAAERLGLVRKAAAEAANQPPPAPTPPAPSPGG